MSEKLSHSAPDAVSDSAEDSADTNAPTSLPPSGSESPRASGEDAPDDSARPTDAETDESAASADESDATSGDVPSPASDGDTHEATVSDATAATSDDVPASPDATTTKGHDQTAWGHEWGTYARSLVLATLLGMAVAVWAQTSFSARWLTGFIQKNDLPLPERMTFLRIMLGVGGGFAAIAAGTLAYREKKGLAVDGVERLLWFLSPLILLPSLPLLFQASAWQGKHEDLLPVVLFGGLILQTLTFQSLGRVPQVVVEAFRDLRDVIPAFLKRHGYTIAVVGGCLFYALFMSFYTIRWHHKLGTAIFDLGINNNLLYGAFDLKFNQSPIIFPDEPSKYIANHIKIGLYGFFPIYWLHPKAETLLVIQSFALGFGALPLYLFSRKRIPEWAAAMLALAYLCYYPMHSANFYEVKLPPIASFFVLMTIWAADARRYWVLVPMFLWALVMREDMPIGLAVIGVFLLLTGHRPVIGLLMAAVSAAWFVFLRFKVMEDVGQWWFPRMYEDLWSPGEQGFKSVIKTLLTNPVFTLKHILVEKKLYYLMHLLVPLMFLPARRWYLWAAFIPGALLTLLVTDYDPPTMFSFQYVMHWAPYMFVAAALALAALYRSSDFGPRRAQAAIVGMCFASIVLTYNYGAFARRDRSFESGYHKITFGFSDKERQTLADARKIIDMVPEEATLAATERVGAHASSRVGFYTLRRGSHGAEYLLAREKGLRLDRTRPVLHEALRSKQYGVYAEVGEFVLFKKGHDTSQNQRIIDDWELGGKKRRKKKPSSTTKPKSKATEKPEDESVDDDAEETMPVIAPSARPRGIVAPDKLKPAIVPRTGTSAAPTPKPNAAPAAAPKPRTAPATQP